MASTCEVKASDADSRDTADGRRAAGPAEQPGSRADSAAGWATGRRACLAAAAAAVAAMTLPSPADAAFTLERPQLFEQVGFAAVLLPDIAPVPP